MLGRRERVGIRISVTLAISISLLLPVHYVVKNNLKLNNQGTKFWGKLTIKDPLDGADSNIIFLPYFSIILEYFSQEKSTASNSVKLYFNFIAKMHYSIQV